MSIVLFQPLGNPVAAGEGLDHVADIDPRLTRTHYFDGRLLTAEDLTRDQIYLDQRLRELGRVLGSGIMSGLELSLDLSTGQLILEPGQALTSAGRVLELGDRLVVNLGNRALISELNDGAYRRFNRGLYVVVLNYVEVGTDVAEVFPTDLGAKRGFQYSYITESVQMGLVQLPLPLPQQSQLLIRSRLMREFLGNDRFSGLIPEDSVALGLLAIQNDTPQWLDAELLRRPLRAEAGMNDLQADLSRQYEKLLADILKFRSAGHLGGDFHAQEYFSLIPPVGTIPKEAINPVTGRQGYFPENYQVAVAPIRQSDVDLIKAESLNLPPIDLTNGEPVEIVVLAPLSNLDYGYYAAQLERGYNSDNRRLPQIDLLKLKLYPLRPVHALDTDAAAWGDIWNRLGDNQPFYVRRPTRAAETAVSGIVLALGTEMPAPVSGGDFEPANQGGLILDANTICLNFMNLKYLAEIRPPQATEAKTAFSTLLQQYGKQPLTAKQCAFVLMRIERRYDQLVWQTLLELAAKKSFEKFLTEWMTDAYDALDGLEFIAKAGGQYLSEDLLKQWLKLKEV